MSDQQNTSQSLDKRSSVDNFGLPYQYQMAPPRTSTEEGRLPGWLAEPHTGALRILLVDNDRSTGRRSEEGLRWSLQCPVEVTHASTLAAATRLLFDERFEVVLLECDLSDSKGISTLIGIRQAAPQVAIVVYAQTLTDPLAFQALREGAHECLEKRAVHPEALARPISFALERQRRISALEAARVDAAYRASHDPLTGLANRELFLTALDRALLLGSRYGQQTGLLFLDLDDFKAINDSRGHARGDAILQVVAFRLVCCMRQSDAVARLGGDEFVVLLPDVASRADLACVKDTLRRSLSEVVDLGGGAPLTIHASIGGALAPLDGNTAQELLLAADADMYREKRPQRWA